jgi:hypothetical protein
VKTFKEWFWTECDELNKDTSFAHSLANKAWDYQQAHIDELYKDKQKLVERIIELSADLEKAENKLKIKDNAPEGSTHYDKHGDYWKIINNRESYFKVSDHGEWVRYEFDHNHDIKNGYIKPL